MSCAPLILLAVLGITRRWMNEDAFIFLRVARNLAEGRGMVFNAGERVEAVTSPLWTGFLALASVLGARLEYVAVHGGLALGVAGLLVGMLALRRAFPDEKSRLVLPLGAAVFAVLPPVWDFVASGFEIGLALLWLGSAFLATVGAITGAGARSGPWRVAAAVVGLGPLIRPELAIHALGLMVVLLGVSRRRGRGVPHLVGLLGIGLALPVAYQLFRMGYFAALVPNTALAKEAFAGNPGAGWRYLVDFFGTYHLLVPVAALAALGAVRIAGAWRSGNGELGLALLAPALTGLVHGGYVVYAGGGFMHGRLLIVPLFAALLPVLTVAPLELRIGTKVLKLRAVAVLVLVAWLPLCGLLWRSSAEDLDGIVDERGWWIRQARADNPVTLDDYAGTGYHGTGVRLARRAGEATQPRLEISEHTWGRPLLMQRDSYDVDQSRVGEGVTLVAARMTVGIVGYAADHTVHLVDRVGLTGPITSRFELGVRGRPGHEKQLANSWLVARFTAPESREDRRVSQARRALGCGAVAELLHAVSAPLTPGLFLENVGRAWRFHRLRIPRSPSVAAQLVCHGRDLREP